jgi:hypothetical protein
MRNNNFFGIALIGNTMSFTWLDHSISLSISSDSNMRIEVCVQANLKIRKNNLNFRFLLLLLSPSEDFVGHQMGIPAMI